MKYKLTIKLIGCGRNLLDEIRNDLVEASQETNFTKEFPDGSVITTATDIVISGTTVTICSTFTGHGQQYEDNMETMQDEILTGEFQADVKRQYSNCKPEDGCTKVKANVIQIPTA